MDPERWQKIEQVFQRALDASPSDRSAILHQCSGDESLRGEVESLLAYHARASSFIETPAVVAVSRRAGTTVGHYRILEEIGGGGMGVVYKAEDTKLGRIVALKFLAEYRTAARDVIERFRGEARAASALNHPNVCVIYDIEEDAGEQFIAMEFIDGRTLAEMVAGGPLEGGTVAAIGSQIADGLAAAHRKGIVHRDIKPANVIVTTMGLVKVLDFGLAKLLEGGGEPGPVGALTHTGPAAGTLPYMSPEQLRGGPVDHRSDIFALGGVLYEMATGQRPFAGDAVPDLIDRILNRPAVAPQQINHNIVPALADIIHRCLEKDPGLRYQRAEEIALALRRLMAPATASLPATQPRRAAFWLPAAVAVATAAAVATWFSVSDRRAAPPASMQWEQLTDFPDSATSPALSPDGRLLTFIRGSSTFVGSGDIYFKMLPGGDPVPLTNDRREKQDPIFSPDASQILYTTGPLPFDVWTVPVTGGEPRLMMRNAGTLTWTDAGRVMFGEIRGIPHMAIVTATENRDDIRDVYVPARASGMAHRAYLSPDKNWVLIAEMDTAGPGWLPCRLVPFDGSSPGEQVGPKDAPCTSAAWSPDGQWMYLSAAAGGSYHIWRQRFPDGAPEQVTFGPTQEEGIAMAPDGRSLITSVGGAQSTLWIRDAHGERKIDSEASVTLPRFSPDGRTLFYLVQKQLRSLDRQSGDLWAVDLASGRRERLLPGLRMVTYDISPDARYVAGTVLDDGGRSHLWVGRLDGQEPASRIEWPTPVTAGRFDPAGGLFFLANEGRHHFVYHADLNGANSRKVLASPVADLRAVSPSGKWLLVRGQMPGGDVSEAGLLAVPASGGPPVPIFASMWPAAQWTPDGKFFYVKFEQENATELAFAVFPIAAENELPALPANGLESARDAARLPGVQVVSARVPTGPDLVGTAVSSDFSTVVMVRTAVHRNLYRVPLP